MYFDACAQLFIILNAYTIIIKAKKMTRFTTPGFYAQSMANAGFHAMSTIINWMMPSDYRPTSIRCM
jgi:hypothetical protein